MRQAILCVFPMVATMKGLGRTSAHDGLVGGVAHTLFGLHRRLQEAYLLALGEVSV